MSAESFPDLRDGLRQGDDEAARLVTRRYAVRLVALARSRLDTWVRHKVDVEGVVQSVFKSFFLRCRNGEYEIAGPDSLWHLLARITVNKCLNRVEYFRAARRDPRQEVAPAGDMAVAPELPARDPTPEQAAALTETLEGVMAGLSDHERDVLALHLQGHDTAAIAEAAGCSVRAARRCLQIVRMRLSAALGEGGPIS